MQERRGQGEQGSSEGSTMRHCKGAAGGSSKQGVADISGLEA